MLRNIFKPKSRLKRRRAKILKPSYRTTNKTTRFSINSKLFKRAIIAMAITMGIIVAFTGILALKVYLSWDLHNKTTWKGDTRQNILIVGVDEKPNGYKFIDMVMLVTVSPSQKKLGIFSVDPDILFTAPTGEEVALRRAYNLDFKLDSSVNNVEYGVEQVLAVEIDKYIMLSEEDFLHMQELVGEVNIELSHDLIDKDYEFKGAALTLESGGHSLKDEQLLGVLSADANGLDAKLDTHNKTGKEYIARFGSFTSLSRTLMHLDNLNGVKTNMSKWEFLKLYRFFWELNSADIRIGYTQQMSLAPEANGKRAYTERLDEDVQSIFLDLDILKEQSRLEVLNGTSQSGIAGKYSRYFSNSGIRVVRYGNSVKEVEKSTLFITQKDKYPYTVEQISSVFDGKLDIIEEEYKYKHVGDMVLVIGEDFIEE